ncbi:MAG: cation:proton antiporter [Sutterella wadsworthensis]
MMLARRRVLPWIMAQVARTGSRELFTLFVLAAAVGIAYGASAIFNVSFALGAFFAGMVMRESKFAHRAATESLPLQDAFSVLFFVGVGMLFDWHIIIEAPLSVLTVLLIIMLGKGLAAFGSSTCAATRRHGHHGAAPPVQIGEFRSFSSVRPARPGDRLHVNLIVGAAILSIALNPVVFSFIPAIGRELTSRWAWARAAALREAPFERVSNETPAEKLHNQIVITGKSRLLPPLATELHKAGAAVVAIVQDHDLATELDKLDVTVIVGNPADPQAMVAAHLKNAGMLMILDNSTTSLRIAEAARAVKGDTPITIVAPDPGIWTDVPGIDGVRFVSSYESAAEKISVDVNTAFAENAPIGTIINTKLAEATAREEERTENTEDKDRDETAAPEQASVSVPQSETTGVAPAAPSDASIELQASSAPSAEAVESVSLSEGSGAETAVPTEEKAAGETKDRPGIFSFLRRKQ